MHMLAAPAHNTRTEAGALAKMGTAQGGSVWLSFVPSFFTHCVWYANGQSVLKGGLFPKRTALRASWANAPSRVCPPLGGIPMSRGCLEQLFTRRVGPRICGTRQYYHGPLPVKNPFVGVFGKLFRPTIGLPMCFVDWGQACAAAACRRMLQNAAACRSTRFFSCT